MGIRPGQAKGPWVGKNSGGAGVGDHKVMDTINDTTPDYLDAKIAVTGGLTKSTLNPGANEQLQISGAGITGDHKVLNTIADTTAGYITDKITVGADGATLTTVNPGANENTRININLTGANVGTGTGQVFRDKTTNFVNLKTIKQGTGITVTNNADDITIAATAADIFVKNTVSDTTAGYLTAKLTVATDGATLTTVNPGANENTRININLTGANVGTGTGLVFRDKTTNFVNLKSIKQGAGITVTNNADDITIAATAVDVFVKNTVNDTTAGYLTAKLTVATDGATLTTVNPGANENTRININLTGANVGTGTGLVFRDKTTNFVNLKSIKQGTGITVTNNADDITIASTAADVLVKNSSADTTADYLSNKLITFEGGSLTTKNAAANEKLNIRALPMFNDKFATVKPFWSGTQVITSADFSIDTANFRINCIAANNTKDWFRYGVEGDFDLIGAFDNNGAAQCGFVIDGNSNTVSWLNVIGSNQIQRVATGQAQVNIAFTGSVVWLRIVRQERYLYFFHRVLGTDSWIYDSTCDLALYDMGYDQLLQFRTGVNSRITEIAFWDNCISQRVKSIPVKVIPMTDGATITPDFRQGSVYTVTLGGNRTIAAPTDPQVRNGTKCIIRLRQDASPPRTVTWNAIYRFPNGTAPILTATANKTDYFGFVFNEVDTKYDCIAQEFNL